MISKKEDTSAPNIKAQDKLRLLNWTEMARRHLLVAPCLKSEGGREMCRRDARLDV